MNCPSCGQLNPAAATFCMACTSRLTTSDEMASALPDDPSISSGFVGRQREMAELMAALEDARSGRGRLVMLAGEPGIGKTRTAQELVAQAESSGCTVLWGRCYEEGGTPPYWPWLQALRSYINQQPPEQLQAEMSFGASEIAEIIPELRDKLPNLEPSHPQEPEQARFRLFSSISTFLNNIARSQTLLLVLDDLHWADRSSLLLLEFISREIQAGPLLILGTYRDVEVSRRHPLSETLGSLIREQSFLRLQLPGLAPREVELLIRNSVKSAPAPSLLAAVHRRTEGNPLFVGEIATMLAREGAAEGQDVLTSIPEGVRDAIGRRLNRLSEDCNRVLTIASIIGREFEMGHLTALVEDMAEEQLLEVLEEALTARVIDELPQAMARYQFSHALIQETLAGELTLTRRVRLHARIAEVLETIYGTDSESHAAELAYHFAEAEAALGTDKLVQYSLLAGEQALASYAWEEAQSHFERGLAARNIPLGGEDPLTDAEAAALTFGFGRARFGTAARRQMGEAANSFSRAFDYYLRSAEAANAIAVAEYPVPMSPSARTGMTPIIGRALTLTAPGSVAEGRLLAIYGFQLGRVEGDYSAAQEVFDRALAIARAAGDVRLELTTLTSSADVDFFQLRLEGSSTNSLAGIELALRAGDTYNEASARQTATRALMDSGERAAAQTQASAFLALGERVRDRYWLVTALGLNSQLACLRGQWSKGRDLSEDALALAYQDPTISAAAAMLEYETGNFSCGEAYLERLLEIMAQAPPNAQSAYWIWPAFAIPYVARISGVPERLSEATWAAQVILSRPSTNPAHTVIARCGLGLQASIQGDSQSAAEQYEGLAMIQGILVPHHLAGDRMLGLLAHTMGELDQAGKHFEDSLTFCRRADYRPELAWTCCDYADSLLQRDGTGDRAKAESLLDASLTISTELGMHPLLERVQSRLQRLAVPPVNVGSYPDGLTQREVEVIKLIAQGLGNREIGENLFISESTVRRHVSNIYDKIGVNNRTEAAGYALREGLTSLEGIN